MIRRSPLLAALAACTAAGAFSASAEAPPPAPALRPRADCTTRITDKPDDAKLVAGVTSNIDGLDMTGVFPRLVGDEFQLWIRAKNIPAPSAMPATDGVYQYVASFKYGDKTATFKVKQGSTQAPWNDSHVVNPSLLLPSADVAGQGLSPFTANVYPDLDVAVFTTPRSTLEGAFGTEFVDGDKFTNVNATTSMIINGKAQDADPLDAQTAPLTNEYVVGDEFCFGGPPGAITDLLAPAVAYTDSVTLSAKLSNDKGEPVAGKPIQFTVAGEAGMPKVATTGADGVAKVTYTPKLTAGKYAVTALYPGDNEVGKAKATGTITVSPETTLFGALAVAKPSSTSRVVTATLLDNDKHVVAGQKVDWYVNGKKVASITTDSKGRSVYKGAKPTQTVQAKYAGATNKYKASASKSVKV